MYAQSKRCTHPEAFFFEKTDRTESLIYGPKILLVIKMIQIEKQGSVNYFA